VTQLIAQMVRKSVSTEQFDRKHVPTTWLWKYIEQCGRHFPYCYRCNRNLKDSHLGSQRHARFACGVLVSFDFPNRRALCECGVRFERSASSSAPGEQITTEWLQADHPLPAGQGDRRHYSTTLLQQSQRWRLLFGSV
jgi:hypothetical protein